MIDSSAIVNEVLSTQESSALFDLIGDDVYEGSDPNFGSDRQAIVWHFEDLTEPVSGANTEAVLVCKCYGVERDGVSGHASAREVMRALRDMIQLKGGTTASGGRLDRAHLLSAQPNLADPETGAPYALVKFRAFFKE